MTQSSFAGTISSGNAGGPVSPVYALRYILKNCPITGFEISVTNADGTRRVDAPKPPTFDKRGKLKKVVEGTKSNASKIQFLLDQRKPPTEKLPSLCAEYDDDLSRIAM